jgi:hypothetical protein
VYVPLLRCTEAGAWQQLGEPGKARACLIAARDAASAMGAWLHHATAERELLALPPATTLHPRAKPPRRQKHGRSTRSGASRR